MAEVKGRIDAPMAMKLMADHLDATQGKEDGGSRCLCGHLDRDATAASEWDLPAFAPFGAINGKVTTAALARNFAFWGRAGHPCGMAFNAASYLEAHPEFRWQAAFLQDAPSRPWSLLRFGK